MYQLTLALYQHRHGSKWFLRKALRGSPVVAHLIVTHTMRRSTGTSICMDKSEGGEKPCRVRTVSRSLTTSMQMLGVITEFALRGGLLQEMRPSAHGHAIPASPASHKQAKTRRTCFAHCSRREDASVWH